MSGINANFINVTVAYKVAGDNADEPTVVLVPVINPAGVAEARDIARQRIDDLVEGELIMDVQAHTIAGTTAINQNGDVMAIDPSTGDVSVA